MKKAHFESCKGFGHVSNIVRTKDDPIVQNGLAITPAEMLELTNKGFAISSQNARILSEVVSPVVGDVPPEFTRGFDMADGYQMMREAHDKARNAVGRLRKRKLPLNTQVEPKTE